MQHWLFIQWFEGHFFFKKTQRNHCLFVCLSVRLFLFVCLFVCLFFVLFCFVLIKFSMRYCCTWHFWQNWVFHEISKYGFIGTLCTIFESYNIFSFRNIKKQRCKKRRKWRQQTKTKQNKTKTKQTNKQTPKQTNKQTLKQINKQTNKQTKQNKLCTSRLIQECYKYHFRHSCINLWICCFHKGTVSHSFDPLALTYALFSHFIGM